MASIALIGPGAIGCMVGAALASSGRHDLVVCAHRAFDNFVVKAEEAPDRVYPAAVITSQAKATPADWVLLCVKAHQTATAADWLKATVGPHTKVAVLQNGVEHRERVAPFLPRDIVVVPVVVELPAERVAPGVVKWNRLAQLLVADDGAGGEFCELFAGTFVKGETTDDLTTRAWQKLCLNVAGGAVLALTGQPMGVMKKSGVIDVARKLIEECVAVGRAEGAKLDVTLVDRIAASFLTGPPDRGNSMYFDRRAGLALEWDARNAVICRFGRKHGIATPVSDTLVPLLSALDPSV